MTSCDPPAISTGTILMIVALALVGAGLVIVGLTSALRRRRA
jgi:hypothetical protein